MSSSNTPPYLIRNYVPGDEAAILALLNDVFPGGWGTAAKWDGKHRRRPGFSGEDIWLAESDNRLVGCLHTAIFQVSLGDGTSVPGAMDGDLAIRKEWTARGIAEALYAGSARSLAARGALLRIGCSESAIRAHYYTRVLGYLAGFDRTRCYKKHLDAVSVRDRIIESIGGRPGDQDAGRGPILEIRLTDLDPIRIRLANPAVTPADTGSRADLVLTGGQVLLSEMATGGPKALARAVFEKRATLAAGPIALARAASWMVRRRTVR